MPNAVVVGVTFFDDGYAGAVGSTVTGTRTIAAGNTILVAATWDSHAGRTASISDNVNGSYGSALKLIADNTNEQDIGCWKFENVAGGSTTVTLTVSNPGDFKAGAIIEISNVVTSGGIDPSTPGQNQQTPTTGTDACTSGNSATLAAQPALVVGIGIDVKGGSPISSGTGYTDNGTSANTGFRVESKRVTATTAVAATFTATVNESTSSIAVIVAEATATAVSDPPTCNNQRTLRFTHPSM